MRKRALRKMSIGRMKRVLQCDVILLSLAHWPAKNQVVKLDNATNGGINACHFVSGTWTSITCDLTTSNFRRLRLGQKCSKLAKTFDESKRWSN